MTAPRLVSEHLLARISGAADAPDHTTLVAMVDAAPERFPAFQRR